VFLPCGAVARAREPVAMAGVQADVATAIGAQVEQMIQQAQKDSEQRVRHELSVARQQLQQMEALIGELGERVQLCRRNNGGGSVDSGQTVDRNFLNSKIAALESKWGSEVKALKQDLHRTILAHNHNSDLMRHHRDALDEARKRLDAHATPKAEQVDEQIAKVDRMLRAGQAKQRALDALTERLTALEAQVGDIMPQPPYPGMGLPGMGGMGGLAVPPGMEGAEATTTKRKGKKDDADVTDEELRRRLLAAQGKGGGETSFNAEAPVFVPGKGFGADLPKPGEPMHLPTGGDDDEDGEDDAEEAEDKSEEAEK